MLACFKTNPHMIFQSGYFSGSTSGNLHIASTLFLNIYLYIYRNLFFAVSPFLMLVMFLNLQPPKHPVLWRRGVQWLLKSLVTR